MKALMTLFATLLSASPLMAQEGGQNAPAASQGGGIVQMVLMVGLALVFFYFILWRPEQKRRKQMEQIRSSLKKGDRITAMGIMGTVIKITETTVVVSLYDGAKMEILRAAITDVQPASSTEEKAVEVER